MPIRMPPIRKPQPLSVRMKRKADKIDLSSAFHPDDVSTDTLRKWAREVAELEKAYRESKLRG